MKTALIGIISDTHGLLRESAVQALQGCSLIIHAGDVGTEDVLRRLRLISRVVAVRGNMDRDRWAEVLPNTEVVSISNVMLYVIHDLMRLELVPSASGFAAVISGHTHEPKIFSQKGVYYLNPGSAGQKRSSLLPSLMRLRIYEKSLDPQIIYLE